MSHPYANMNDSDAHQEAKTVKDLVLLKAMWPFIKPQARWIIISLALLPLVSLTQVVQPFVVKNAIDGPIKAGDLHGLTLWVVAFTGLLLIHYVLRYAQMLVAQQTGQRVILALRNHFYNHLQRLSVSFYQATPVGKVVTRVSSDVENVSEMFASGGVEIFIDISMIVGILIAMLVMNPVLAMVTVCILPFVFGVMEYFRRKSRGAYNQMRVQLAEINTTLQESLTGMDVIQLLNRQDYNTEQFGKLNQRYLKTNLKSIVYDCSFSASIEWFSYSTMLAIIGVYIWIQWSASSTLGNLGWFETLSQDKALTIGELVAFIQYVQMLFNPLESISEKFTIIQSGLASIEKLDEILSVEPKIITVEHPIPLPERVRGQVTFDHVRFGYIPEQPVLRDLNLEIRAGEKVALIGATGAGKSTIIKLLNRLYDPDAGQVCVDGMAITQVDVQQLRSQIVVIPQEEFIFSRSIEENITLAPKDPHNKAHRDKLRAIAETMHALDFIERLPDGFDTVLSERGRNLSNGERQLLVFARAMWHDPAILVLDEATASVDPNTEALVQDALYKAIQGRTAIIIAHRLSTIEEVDTIYVLQDGKVAESGSPKALYEAGGLYRGYYDTLFSKA